jgi:hypothetical protein
MLLEASIADRKNKTALMWLVDPQFHIGLDVTAAITLLIDGGVPIKVADDLGRTALLWAVSGFRGNNV